MPWRNDEEARRHSNATYGAAWRRARLACLRAASWRCEIRLDGCQGAASQVDHMLGAANDPKHQHLRAACESCHGKVTAQQGGGWRNRTPKDPPPQQRTSW